MTGRAPVSRRGTRIGWLFLLLCAAASPGTAPATAPPATIGRDRQKLVEGLGAGDPAERERAARELLSLGRDARPALLEAMESDDPQLRLSAAGLILRLPFDRPEDPPAVAGFLKQYGRPTAAARITYLPAILSAAGTSAPRVLLRLVREDPSDEVRWAIVNLVRTLDRKALPGIEAFERSSPRSPNLALAAWAWETKDYPTAVQIYRRWLELESRQPTRDNGAADFAFATLLNVAVWDRDYDRAADVYRVQSARSPVETGRYEGKPDELDHLFALHATYGPLRGFGGDLAAASLRIPRPPVLYALGRLYQHRLGQNLVADALYRAAYAAGMGSIAARDAAGEFLVEHQWNDLAEGEVMAALAIETDPHGVHSANANLRMGLLLARRGADLGAARHKERAMEALRGLGGTLTRVRGGRTYTDGQVRDQLWAEIHWHYFRAARAAGDRAEMDKRLTALLALAPDDEQIALDAIPLLIEMGRTDDAAKLFARPYAYLRGILDEKPDDPERMNNLAWLCGRAGQRLDEALTLITAALTARPTNYAYLDTAAEIHFQLGRIDRAVELEAQANELKPDDDFLRSQLRRFRAARK